MVRLSLSGKSRVQGEPEVANTQDRSRKKAITWKSAPEMCLKVTLYLWLISKMHRHSDSSRLGKETEKQT
jgi:hypothetical protein